MNSRFTMDAAFDAAMASEPPRAPTPALDDDDEPDVYGPDVFEFDQEDQVDVLGDEFESEPDHAPDYASDHALDRDARVLPLDAEFDLAMLSATAPARDGGDPDFDSFILDADSLVDEPAAPDLVVEVSPDVARLPLEVEFQLALDRVRRLASEPDVVGDADSSFDDAFDFAAQSEVQSETPPDQEEQQLESPESNSSLPTDVEFDLAMFAAAPPQPERDESVGVDLAAEPAFADMLAARAADGSALLEKEARHLVKRAFDFGTGDVWAPAGATTVVTISPQCVFRIENLMASDTSSNPGHGTSIVQVTVGQKVQRPGNTPQGSLTHFFSAFALANGVTFDTSHAWEQITLTINFIQACTFNANFFGTAEVSEAA